MIFRLKIALCGAWVLAYSVALLPLCVLWWRNPRLNRVFFRGMGWGVLRILGISTEIRNAKYISPDYQPCVYTINHQSGLDIFTFGLHCPPNAITLGKREIVWIPIWGWLFIAGGNLLVRRQNREQALNQVGIAARAIRDRRVSVGISPEGTRNQTDAEMLPFKKGAFYMAIEAQVPIVPVVCSSIRKVYDWKRRRTGPIRRVILQALPPISTRGLDISHVNDLANAVRAEMLEAFRALNREVEAHATSG